MKHAKLMSSLLVLAIIFGWNVNSNAAGDEVSLFSAKGQSSTSPGNNSSYVTWHLSFNGFVKLKNLAYAKQVQIIYRDTLYSNEWKSADAAYFKTLSDGSEVWSFTAGALNIDGWKVSRDYEFAIKYAVNGREYWDNNNGSNYKVGAGYAPQSGQQVLGKNTNVAVQYSYLSLGRLSAQISVRNIAYNKIVAVRYTTDNWKTSAEAPAGFYQVNYQQNGFEIWKCEASVDASVKEVKFAVKYAVNGQEYWDNNFESNYVNTLP